MKLEYGHRKVYRKYTHLTNDNQYSGSNPIYVAPDGDDSTGTGAIGAPYKTIGKGIEQVIASSGSKDSVRLKKSAGGSWLFDYENIDPNMTGMSADIFVEADGYDQITKEMPTLKKLKDTINKGTVTGVTGTTQCVCEYGTKYVSTSIFLGTTTGVWVSTDGITFTQPGGYPTASCLSLVMSGGYLWAACPGTGVYRWNGTVWSGLLTGGTNLAVLCDVNGVCCGIIPSTSSSYAIKKWDLVSSFVDITGTAGAWGWSLLCYDNKIWTVGGISGKQGLYYWDGANEVLAQSGVYGSCFNMDDYILFVESDQAGSYINKMYITTTGTDKTEIPLYFTEPITVLNAYKHNGQYYLVIQGYTSSDWYLYMTKDFLTFTIIKSNIGAALWFRSCEYRQRLYGYPTTAAGTLHVYQDQMMTPDLPVTTPGVDLIFRHIIFDGNNISGYALSYPCKSSQCRPLCANVEAKNYHTFIYDYWGTAGLTNSLVGIVIHDCDYGMVFMGYQTSVYDVSLINGLLYDIKYTGVYFGNTGNSYVAYSTFYNCGKAIEIGEDHTTYTARFINSIFHENGYDIYSAINIYISFETSVSTGTVFSNNIVNTNIVNSNPLFVSEVDYDFRLQCKAWGHIMDSPAHELVAGPTVWTFRDAGYEQEIYDLQSDGWQSATIDPAYYDISMDYLFRGVEEEETQIGEYVGSYVDDLKQVNFTMTSYKTSECYKLLHVQRQSNLYELFNNQSVLTGTIVTYHTFSFIQWSPDLYGRDVHGLIRYFPNDDGQELTGTAAINGIKATITGSSWTVGKYYGYWLIVNNGGTLQSYLVTDNDLNTLSLYNHNGYSALASGNYTVYLWKSVLVTSCKWLGLVDGYYKLELPAGFVGFHYDDQHNNFWVRLYSTFSSVSKLLHIDHHDDDYIYCLNDLDETLASFTTNNIYIGSMVFYFSKLRIEDMTMETLEGNHHGFRDGSELYLTTRTEETGPMANQWGGFSWKLIESKRFE